MSDDKKKLTVQFFWQPQYSHGNKDPVDLLEEPLSSRDLRFTLAISRLWDLIVEALRE
jgi:hypothetical protein